MCIGGASTPAPPPALPEAPRLPEQTAARDSVGADKRRRAAAAGGTGTILTSSRGVTQQAATAGKTLLGE